MSVDGRSPTRLWLGALAATLLLQATAAFLTRLVPTIAPAAMPAFGWSETAIGYLAAVTTFGSIAFLLTGNPLIRRVGPIRALQIGMLLGALGVAVLALPIVIAPIVASFLLGVGCGPSTPAGSEVLQRHAPPWHRNLIFSIKQAGVPGSLPRPTPSRRNLAVSYVLNQDSRLRTIRSVFTHPPMKRISNAAPPFPAEISLRAVAGAGA